MGTDATSADACRGREDAASEGAWGVGIPGGATRRDGATAAARTDREGVAEAEPSVTTLARLLSMLTAAWLLGDVAARLAVWVVS